MFFDIFKAYCEARGVSPKRAVTEMGLSNSIATKWKKTGATPQGETLFKIAEYFGVTVDELMPNQKETPALTEKDERDISKKLDETLAALEGSAGGLMFDGEPLDEVTKELLIASLRKDLEMGKRIAKQKYTPKKYRKPDDPEDD